MSTCASLTLEGGGIEREEMGSHGNRLRVERRVLETATTPTQTDTYTLVANTNRLASIATTAGTTTFSADGRGNQSVERWPDGTVITVAYDSHGRLTRYRVGTSNQTMLYNGEDERIRVVTTPAVGLADTRTYIYDLDNRIVGEYGATGVADVKAEYIWTLPEVGATGPTGDDDGLGGYMPLAVSVGQTGDMRWVHSHHNDAPIIMTNSAGSTVTHGDHAVMGFPGQFANARQLAGAQHYNNRYRDYNPITGRYIQADPIGLAGDENPYLYALGNPLRYNDPLGLDSWLVNFPDQPIHAPKSMGGGTIPFSGGHSGNVAVNQYTGQTAYREYGRYGDTSAGSVRGPAVGDLAIQDGIPTASSIAGLLNDLARIGADAGSSNMRVTITRGTSFSAQMAYAGRIRGAPGNWGVFGPNCHTFASNMAATGRPAGFPARRTFSFNAGNTAAVAAEIRGFYGAGAPRPNASTPRPRSTPNPNKPDWILP